MIAALIAFGLLPSTAPTVPMFPGSTTSPATRCDRCGSAVSLGEVFRCYFCRAALCERCAGPHFMPRDGLSPAQCEAMS